MTVVTPIPHRTDHSTAAVAGALSTLYGTPASKVPSDPLLRQIGAEVVALFGVMSPQLQSDIYLAKVREASVK